MLNVKESALFLRKCQVLEGEIAGTECPWELDAGMPPREDFHDTMQAIYVWSLKENFDDNSDYLDRAIAYMKSRRKFLEEEAEPMKSYDSTCLILGAHMYLSQHSDEEVSALEDYALDHLKSYFIRDGGPAHNARDYSNPYLKAAILGYVLKDRQESTEFLDSWLSKDMNLQSAESEPAHRGPGYQYPHDFVSTFGSKLFALGVVSTTFDFSSAVALLPQGFTSREHDEISFNSTVLLGIGAAMRRTDGTVRSSYEKAASPIRAEIESRIDGGGLKRGNYFPIRESWPTFFATFADIIIERGNPFASEP